MAFVYAHKFQVIGGGIAALLLVTLIVNFLIIRYSGSPVPAPDIPREVEHYGTGKPLRYAVLGDSTTISQGGSYDKGYARGTARFLASRGYAVRFQNFGVSGARAEDVRRQQVEAAAATRPDVAIIAVGANDVIRLSGISSVRHSLETTIDTLRAGNSGVRIVVTGSPQMGSVLRFPWPADRLARLQTNRLNTAMIGLATQRNVVFAPVAEKTGPVFAKHPELYAADNFHPNDAGYALWTPVLNDALSKALAL